MHRVKKYISSRKKIFLHFLWFFFGLLLGYYFGYDHGWEKYIQTPYSHKPTTSPICNALTNITPGSGTKITSPLSVTVTIDNTQSCNWTVFEAQAGILTLKDSNDEILGTGTLTTTSEWMTEQPVVYTGTFEFTKPATDDVTLIIEEEDPSGEGSQTVSIPLTY
jgi:hypothetical protein